MVLNRAYLLASVSVGALLIGQLLFKRVANLIAGAPLSAALTNASAMWLLFVALCIYAFATLFWVLALRNLPLSRAYMLMSVGFIVIPLLSYFFFAEPLSSRFVIGSLMIAAGIVLTNS